jgi:aromatic-L-amino-acid/L-tryptophan decarboxylase
MTKGKTSEQPFKAFKIWCALEAFGLNAFRAAASVMLDMAQYLGQCIERSAEFVMMAPVKLSAVCFRLRSGEDAANHTLLRRLTASGVAILGPVRIGGTLGLRACVTNFRTTRADIDLIIDMLRSLAHEIA